MAETGSRAQTVSWGVALALTLGLIAAIWFPLWQPFVLALVLAGTLGHFHERLSAKLGGRRGLCAAIILVIVFVLVVIPVTAMIAVVAKEAIAAAESALRLLQREGPKGLVSLAPGFLQPAINRLLAERPEWARTLAKTVPSQGVALLGTLGGALTATGSLAFQAAMMLVALYFLLVDGPRLATWVREVSPLGHDATAELIHAARATAVGVLFSAAITALVQALVAGLGYQIAGIPHPLFFAGLTFFAAFIPSVGTTLVWIPLSGYLLLTGHWARAIFLLAWSLLLTGTIDNLLKPLLARGRAELHGALLFFAMIGGIVVLGPLGLIVGPTALSVLLALIRVAKGGSKAAAPGAG